MRKINTDDLLNLAALVRATGIKEELSKQFKSLIKGKKVVINQDEDGIEIIFAIISAFGKDGAKEAFYKFLSGPFEMTPEEIANNDPVDTLNKIKQTASLNEWISFFKHAVK